MDINQIMDIDQGQAMFEGFGSSFHLTLQLAAGDHLKLLIMTPEKVFPPGL